MIHSYLLLKDNFSFFFKSYKNSIHFDDGFALPFSSLICPTSAPINFSLFLSLYKTNRQVQKRIKVKEVKKQNKENPQPETILHKKNTNEIKSLLQNKIRQKIYKNTLGSILCWPSTLGLRPPLMYDINN